MSLEQFWEKVHHDGKGFWLTDTPPEDYIRNLELDLDSPQSIMEIGVGRGLMIRYLITHGHKVTAVDISHLALLLLPRTAWMCHTDNLNDEPAGNHDLAISYLTIQHVDAEMAKYLIEQAVRICGVFKFQMASLIDPDKAITGYTADHSQDGPLFMHDLSDFRMAMPETKFRLMSSRLHPAQNIAWHFVEAR